MNKVLLTAASFCAVESLVDLSVLQEELSKPADEGAESHPAVQLLEDAFGTPEVFVASFGKPKQLFTSGCGGLQEQSSPPDKTKDSATQVSSSRPEVFAVYLNVLHLVHVPGPL